MAEKLWVLDWSGVVSNDFLITVDSSNWILRHFGADELEPDEMRRYFQRSPSDYWIKNGYDFNVVWRMHEDFLRNHARKPDPIPGAVDAVRSLKKYAPVAVFSSHPEQELYREIWRFGLQHDLAYALGGVRKDRNSDFERLLELADVKKERIILADDTSAGIILAHNAGVRSVAVVHPEYGYQAREIIEKCPIQPSLGYRKHVSELEDFANIL
jgi:phosphoglycolate phosphatase-like HAD superfamily hydrolase